MSAVVRETRVNCISIHFNSTLGTHVPSWPNITPQKSRWYLILGSTSLQYTMDDMCQFYFAICVVIAI